MRARRSARGSADCHFTPQCSANRSTARNPRLCGVNWYSMPGLPSPTISFTLDYPASASARAHGFVTGSSLEVPLRQPGLELRCQNANAHPALCLHFFSFFSAFSGFSASASAPSFFDLLLALLDDFGLGRSGGGFGGGGFRRGCDFFLHGDDVGHRLVGIGKELELSDVGRSDTRIGSPKTR